MEREPIESTAVRLEVGDESQPAAEQAAASGVIADETLVKIFVKIRDAKKAFTDAHEAELLQRFEQPLKQISTELKKRLQSRTNEGLKTSYGTVYLAETLKVSCQDWGIFYEWIKKNDALDFLEQRVKAGEIKTYMEKHDGELPPGVSVFRETEARIRKPKTPSSNGRQAPDPADGQ